MNKKIIEEDKKILEEEKNIIEEHQKMIEENMKMTQEDKNTIEEDKNTKIELEKLKEQELMIIKQGNLPIEMNPGDSDSTTIVIRFPSGKKIEKLWNKRTIFQQIYDFIDASNIENIKPESYIIVQTFPKKEFPVDKTLEEEGLFPGGIINIVEK